MKLQQTCVRSLAVAARGVETADEFEQTFEYIQVRGYVAWSRDTTSRSGPCRDVTDLTIGRLDD